MVALFALATVATAACGDANDAPGNTASGTDDGSAHDPATGADASANTGRDASTANDGSLTNDGSTSNDADVTDASSTDAANSDASVTLDAGTDAASTIDASASDTFFSTGYCPGTTITNAQLISHFPPASTTTVLTTVTMLGRQRECQDVTGCLGWTVSTELPFFHIEYSNHYSFDRPVTIAVPATGKLVLSNPGQFTQLTIDLDATPDFDSNLVLPGAQAAGFQTTLAGEAIQLGGWSSGGGTYLWFYTRAMTASCVIAIEDGRVYHPANDGTYTEYEASIFGTY